MFVFYEQKINFNCTERIHLNKLKIKEIIFCVKICTFYVTQEWYSYQICMINFFPFT